jgi:tight adherence protein B
MNPLVSAITLAVVIFVAMLVIASRLGRDRNSRSKQMLQQLGNDHAFQNERMMDENASIMRTDFGDNKLMQAVSQLPYGDVLCEKMLRAGMEDKANMLFFLCASLSLLLPVLFYQASGSFVIALLGVFLPTYMLWRLLQGKISKRNAAFIADFPDVLDMIVRSVRSGFPLNTALRMVAENMEPPISTEFRQVVDEVALGRSLDDALVRLSQRIDEQDVKFFIVVLRVQQETGGNLAEVVQNLSNVIRKRKQLRLKIRAMTSEGRATGWILGAIPVLMFVLLYFSAPEHMEPLLTTEAGHMWLGIAASLVVLAQIVVRKMLDVEI